MRRLLHSIDALYTCDDAGRVLRNAFVVVEDGRIAAVGSGRPDGDFAAAEDLSGKIVLPGFVNLHHHYFQTLTRAIPAAQRGHLTEWLFRMYPVWAGMTPGDLAVATRASVAQLLLTGATTSVDHSYLLPRGGTDYVEAQVEAAHAMGARLVFVRGSMTSMEADLETRLSAILGQRAGGLVDDPDTVLRDMKRTIDRHHDTSHGSMISVALGPTTTTFADPAFMRAVASLAEDARCGLHIHCHPRPDERALCAAMGTTPIDFLAAAGWLTPRTFFAHSTRLRVDEMQRCAGAGVSVAHCPRMILRLGARVTPLHQMLSAGMRAGIGVDGGASNDSGSMLGELRVAMLLHRLAGGEGEVDWKDWLMPMDVLRLATREAAAILGRADIGRLEPGLCADLVAFDLTGVGYAGALTDPLAALLLAGDDDRASLTMVGGRILVRDRRLVDHDERLLRQQTDAATARLIETAARSTGLDYRAFE